VYSFSETKQVVFDMNRQGDSPESDVEPDADADSASAQSSDSEDSLCKLLRGGDSETDEETRAAYQPEPVLSFIQYRRLTRKIIHRYEHIRNLMAVKDAKFDEKPDRNNRLLSIDFETPGATVDEVEEFEEKYGARMPADVRAVMSIMNGGACIAVGHDS
jgi:hypothetical protein